MKNLHLIVLIVILSLSVNAWANVLIPKTGLFCNKKDEADGITIMPVNKHILSQQGGGVEIQYFRILKSTNRTVEALEIFEGLPEGISEHLTQPTKHRKVTLQIKKKAPNLYHLIITEKFQKPHPLSKKGTRSLKRTCKAR